MRQSEHHNWDIPTEGDTNYDNIFDNLINGIDHDALSRVDGLPSNHIEGRWLIDTTDQAVYYDDGSNFIQIDPERTISDQIAARVNEDESVGAEWTFNQSIDADIDGRSEHAGQVNEADDAQDAERLNEYTPDQLADKNSNITITGYWTFQQRIVLQRLNVVNDTLGLPRHG